MPIDLSNPIKVNVVSVSEKPNGGAKISVEVLDMSQYPFPLHLTPDQAATLDGVGEYTALLVQSKLKDGKDGSWQSDYWYNAAMFEGVTDERNMPRSTPEPKGKDPNYTVKNYVPYSETKEGVTAKDNFSSMTPEQKSRNDLIVKQVIFKEASNHAVGDTNEEIVMNLDLLFKGFTSVFYGDYNASPLVEEASKQGAKIVEIRPTEEPLFEPEESSLDNTVWDYQKPKLIKTNADFWAYTEKCAWIMEDVVKWLDGLDVDKWCDQNKKTYLYAAKECKDKALEQGLEPPFDFRQEKKETK